MYELQDNVPLPKAARKSARRKYPFEDMVVGGMFFVPHKTKNTLATHTSTVGKKLGRKFATRLVWMLETAEGWHGPVEPQPDAVQGIGVWRVE